jgi:hypothetical protein
MDARKFERGITDEGRGMETLPPQDELIQKVKTWTHKRRRTEEARK